MTTAMLYEELDSLYSTLEEIIELASVDGDVDVDEILELAGSHFEPEFDPED